MTRSLTSVGRASFGASVSRRGREGPPEFVALEHVTSVANARGTRSLGCHLGLQTANGRSRERPSKTQSC